MPSNDAKPVCLFCNGSGRAISVDSIKITDGVVEQTNPRDADCICCDGTGRSIPDVEEQEPNDAKPVDLDALERLNAEWLLAPFGMGVISMAAWHSALISNGHALIKELRAARERIAEHERWLRRDSQHAENERLREQVAALTVERDNLQRLLDDARVAIDRDNEIALGLMEQRDAVRAENLRLREALKRVYPYFEAVNHVHMPDGSILYASALWDVLNRSAATKPEALAEGFVYLASPYSHPDKAVMQDRFEQVCIIAAHLMSTGSLIFSPIAHTHPIAVRGDLPRGWDFWQRYDRAMLLAAAKVVVVKMDGWKESRGIAGEIKIALAMGKPVEYLEIPERRHEA